MEVVRAAVAARMPALQQQAQADALGPLRDDSQWPLGEASRRRQEEREIDPFHAGLFAFRL